MWQKVRAASLTPEQLDGPLMSQPYCLRHAGVTRRLNEGVDEATVAAWAGHSVEVLRRIYHHSVGGQDEILIARMDAHRRRSLWGPWGTHGGRNTAQGGIGGQRMALADIITIHLVAGERRFYPGQAKRPQQDSNLRTQLRRAQIKMALTSTNPRRGPSPGG